MTLRRIVTLIAAGACCAIVSVSILSTGSQSQEAPFGSENDVGYASALWKALEDLRLVGANAIAARPYEGLEPHGAVLQTLKTTVKVEGHEGQVIVKRNFGPAGVTLNQVWSNPDQHLAATTVMFKRQDGYDPNNQNWFWVKYNPDGSLDHTDEGTRMAGKVVGCINCHKAAAGGDYVYINDK